MLAKSLVQTSMAVLVWKTICTPSSSCFPLTHFHLLSSFSHLILLCLHVKNKGFHITNLGSPILPKKQKALWSHTFPTLSAYSTHSDVKGDQELLVASSELNSFLFSISHAQSTESLPKVSIDLFTMVPHNWYRVSFPKLPSASQTIFLSLSPYVHTYLSHPLRTPLSLPPLPNYSWREGAALPTFILHDSTPILRSFQQHTQTSLCCHLSGLSVTHLSKLRLQPISNKHCPCTLLYMQTWKKRGRKSLCLNFPYTQHPPCLSFKVLIQHYEQTISTTTSACLL